MELGPLSKENYPSYATDRPRLSSCGSISAYVPYIEVFPRVEYQECRCCGTRTRDMAREQCTQCGASLIDQIE